MFKKPSAVSKNNDSFRRSIAGSAVYSSSDISSAALIPREAMGKGTHCWLSDVFQITADWLCLGHVSDEFHHRFRFVCATISVHELLGHSSALLLNVQKRIDHHWIEV